MLSIHNHQDDANESRTERLFPSHMDLLSRTTSTASKNVEKLKLFYVRQKIKIELPYGSTMQILSVYLNNLML